MKTSQPNPVHQPSRGNFMFVKSATSKAGAGEGGSRPEKWNNDRQNKVKTFGTSSSHGRNENTITIYTAYKRMFLGLIVIDNSTSVFHSLAVTLLWHSVDTLPCSRIYSLPSTFYAHEYHEWIVLSDIRGYNISFTSDAVFNLRRHCIVTIGENIEVSRGIISTIIRTIDCQVITN